MCEPSLGEHRLVVNLSNMPNIWDHDILKKEFLRFAIDNEVISAFGGDLETRDADLIILRYEKDFKTEIMVGKTETICHMQDDLMIKVRKG